VQPEQLEALDRNGPAAAQIARGQREAGRGGSAGGGQGENGCGEERFHRD
jgi:hypothetical protein